MEPFTLGLLIGVAIIGGGSALMDRKFDAWNRPSPDAARRQNHRKMLAKLGGKAT